MRRFTPAALCRPPYAADEIVTVGDIARRDPLRWDVYGLSVCGWWTPLAVGATHNTMPAGQHSSGGNVSLPDTFMQPRWCDNSTTYRFTFSAIRFTDPVVDGIQLSQLSLYGPTGEALAVSSATNPGGVNHPNQRANNLVDGNVATKWFDGGFNVTTNSVLLVTLASPSLLTTYELTTASDVPRRDPMSWTLERLHPSTGAWVPLSTIDSWTPPMSRQASFGVMYAVAPPPSSKASQIQRPGPIWGNPAS